MARIRTLLLVLFCIGAVAANLPRDWTKPADPADRRSDVLSAFVLLGATPGSDVIPFMENWAELTGQTARARKARLAHLHPDVVALHAAKQGIEIEALREIAAHGDGPHLFDLSGNVTPGPAFEHHGTAGAWSWGVSVHGNALKASQRHDVPWCPIWLVFWTDGSWYYAPMGTPGLNTLLTRAVPDLTEVPFDDLPACTAPL